MTEQQLVPIEAQKQIQEALSFCQSVAEITIADNSEYEKACALTRKVREIWKEIDASRKNLKAPYSIKAREVDGVFKDPLTSIKNIERKLSRATSDYEIAIENEIRRVAEEKAEAERKRIEAERHKPGLLPPAGTPPFPPLPPTVIETPPPPPPKVAGKQSIPKWTAEITDKAAFLKYVVENGELLLVDVNIKMLNKMAQDVLGELSIPGVKCNKEMVSRYT